MGIVEIFRARPITYSFEVFPVSTPEAYERLKRTIAQLCELKPDFISCTYGAGGGNRDRTFEIVEHVQKTHGVPAMAHLTCVTHTREEIASILGEFGRRGITNVLALRGDPPKDAPPGAVSGDFRYSSELVAFIRERMGPGVSIGVAGFPEKHPLAASAESDAEYLREKLRAGADFVITQLFFDNARYFEYVRRLGALGVKARVIPGVLPIVDYEGLKRFCEKCGAVITPEVHRIFGPLAGDPVRTAEAGVDFAVRQCRELLDGGAPGIHFYALNKSASVSRILERLRG